MRQCGCGVRESMLGLDHSRSSSARGGGHAIVQKSFPFEENLLTTEVIIGADLNAWLGISKQFCIAKLTDILSSQTNLL